MKRTIEEELKQTHFQSETHRFVLNLLVTANRLMLQNAQTLRPHDLTLPQYNVLRILRGRHPESIHICDIADRMIDKSSNASRLIDKLEGKKLAKRTPSPQDRRAMEVQVTEKGLALLKELDREMEAQTRPLMGLDPKALAQAGLLLDEIRQHTACE